MALDPARDLPLPDTALDQLFTAARTRNAWTDRPVSDDLLRKLYELTKFGPTALQAPVNVIIGMDLAFAEKLPVLFPLAPGAKDWFADPAAARETAFRNSSLQGGYFLLAARALGLDAGPMSGFDTAGVKAGFFAGTAVEPNFIVNLGYGSDENLFPRSPRLAFEEAVQIL